MTPHCVICRTTLTVQPNVSSPGHLDNRPCLLSRATVDKHSRLVPPGQERRPREMTRNQLHVCRPPPPRSHPSGWQAEMERRPPEHFIATATITSVVRVLPIYPISWCTHICKHQNAPTIKEYGETCAWKFPGGGERGGRTASADHP